MTEFLDWLQNPTRLVWSLIVMAAIGFAAGWLVKDWRTASACDTLQAEYEIANSDEYQNAAINESYVPHEFDELEATYGFEAADAIMSARTSSHRAPAAYLAAALDAYGC